jgi:hypothetical protein
MNMEEPLALGSVVSDTRWGLVQRVADSAHFQKSHRLREFLIYVSERTLLGHPEDVREQQIGYRVFKTFENNRSGTASSRGVRITIRARITSCG